MTKVVKMISELGVPPFIQQTPNSSGLWGDYQFIWDDNVHECDYLVAHESLCHEKVTVLCPPKNTIFIAGEYSIRNYDEKFLRQFHHVITCKTNLNHPNIIPSHPGIPWFINKSYDELKYTSFVLKSKKISVVASNKEYIAGHKKRLRFASALKDYFGDAVDFFGRGIRPFKNKWEVLAPYQYSIAIENDVGENYITEKLFECYLAHTFPIYYGAPNVEEYFSGESFIAIDIDDFQSSRKLIENLLDGDEHYNRNLHSLIEAKHAYLDRYQLFPMLVGMIETKCRPNFNAKQLLTIQASYDPPLSDQLKVTVKNVIRKFADGVQSTANRLLNNTHAVRHKEWLEVKGDETLRLDYELNHDSLVFDLGVDRGDWSSKISLRYKPYIHLFVPFSEDVSQVNERFGKNTRIIVHGFGLARERRDDERATSSGSSVPTNHGTIRNKWKSCRAEEFLKYHNVQNVDLCRIDIEGREYDLLEHLLETGLVIIFRDIQIQFHDFVPDATERMRKIQTQLSHTHYLTYQYEFISENWRLKSSAQSQNDVGVSETEAPGITNVINV